MNYEAVIGLEIHCQLKTKTKIFCSDPYEFGAPANTLAGPVTLGLPGCLPVLNEKVLEMAIMAGLALNCNIARITKFDRKHYFYPDLPKGYQISQYDRPYATNGYVEVKKPDNQTIKVRIHRIHMEEDAGKLLHSSYGGETVSFVDLNRAGVPLLEIVTEPDLRSSEDAWYFLQTLRGIIRALGISEANMEEGSLRCDANVSVRKPGGPLGTRVEIKNLNSFKAVRNAIDYEIERQISVLESGGTIIQSTVLWDADRKETRLMRTKEDAEDYRYFPEPDLPVFEISPELVESIKNKMPELPDQKRDRYIKEYHLPEYDATVLSREMEIAHYFEETVKYSGDPKKSSNWVKDEVLGIINKRDISITQFECTPKRLGTIIKLLNEGKITQRIAKQVFEHVYEENLDPEEVIEKYGYKPVDSSNLKEIVDKIFEKFPEQVQQILNGKDKVKGFLVGQIMKETRGQAPPQEVNKLIDEKIQSLKK
ncbi:MAG: aspartyl/glutamyl-tRNA(Asn/Gln) amidotransferase subunit B [Leptospiraceae bacterium]|nr:MAG: aspartyl/glutamyl-tRNA(Asn/Gln) amidotransferase subunit B [Leptospiraceae bacterium]GIX43541.1 MAG: aspartyl/glutamyl-tRNA(Asn/Gln) amidotransferase subunit B [Leptospiraceae bacterium]